VRIREADPARDAAAISAIYAPYVIESVASLEERAPGMREVARRMDLISARYPWLVAEDGDIVIGYAYASSHRERAAYRWAAEVAIYVDRDHHRRGVGRALYRELLSRLEGQGVQLVFAGITLPNDASVRLHEAVGFHPVGVFRQIGFKHGSWHDVGWWQRDLRQPRDTPPRELRRPSARPTS
jgi:L-amino acid N-acyltransferase YncA